MLILIFASYAQQKLTGVKAGEQISFYAEKTDSIKTNSSRTSVSPLHTRNTGRQRGIFHWINAQRISADAVTEIRRKREKLSRIPRTVNHSTAGTTAELLLEYTLTLWKSETVHGPKNNPDSTKFFQISKKQDSWKSKWRDWQKDIIGMAVALEPELMPRKVQSWQNLMLAVIPYLKHSFLQVWMEGLHFLL